jgi:hypothetical protein
VPFLLYSLERTCRARLFPQRKSQHRAWRLCKLGDVAFWHEADIEELTAMSAFGGKAGL